MPDTIPDRLPVLKSLDVEVDLLSLARIPGGDEVFAGGFNGVVYHVNLAEEKPTARPLTGGHVSYVSALACCQDFVLSAGSDHRITWWHRNSQAIVRMQENAHSSWVRDLAVHPGAGVLASVGDDMVCRLWDIATGNPVAELKGHTLITQHHFRNKLFTCKFSRDGKFLATADQTGRIVIWDFETKKEAAAVDAAKFYEWDYTSEVGNDHSYGGVRALDFSPDGSRLAVGGILNTDAAITSGQALLHIYDWHAGSLVAEHAGGGNFFYEDVRFHHNGDWVVATPGAGNGTNVNFLHPAEPKVIKKSEGQRTYDMVMSENSDSLYVVGPKRIAKLGIYAAT